MMGKKAVPIEGVGAVKCDFVGMDAPRAARKDAAADDAPLKSGNMSADMDAALRKLENRRAAAAIHQPNPQATSSNFQQKQLEYDDARDNSSREAKRPSQNKTQVAFTRVVPKFLQGLMGGVHDDPESAATRNEKLNAKRAEFLDRADLEAFETDDAEALRALVEKDGGMLIMDASVMNSKSRHAAAAEPRQAALSTSADGLACLQLKVVAQKNLHSLDANEKPEKPVFVKKDKRETRFSEAAESLTTKRSADSASIGASSKKPLCSFEDE